MIFEMTDLLSVFPYCAHLVAESLLLFKGSCHEVSMMNLLEKDAVFRLKHCDSQNFKKRLEKKGYSWFK